MPPATLQFPRRCPRASFAFGDRLGGFGAHPSQLCPPDRRSGRSRRASPADCSGSGAAPLPASPCASARRRPQVPRWSRQTLRDGARQSCASASRAAARASAASALGLQGGVIAGGARRALRLDPGLKLGHPCLGRLGGDLRIARARPRYRARISGGSCVTASPTPTGVRSSAAASRASSVESFLEFGVVATSSPAPPWFFAARPCEGPGACTFGLLKRISQNLPNLQDLSQAAPPNRRHFRALLRVFFGGRRPPPLVRHGAIRARPHRVDSGPRKLPDKGRPCHGSTALAKDPPRSLGTAPPASAR